ncbi:hypothetical protein Hanom_Chr16g01424591 [Helianthus anomalus]
MKAMNIMLREKSEKLLSQAFISHKEALKEHNQIISKFKHEANVHSAQLGLLLLKYQTFQKELESTHVNCQKWIESCKGFEILLNQQIQSNVKFGLEYNHTQGPSHPTPKTQSEIHSISSKEFVNISLGPSHKCFEQHNSKWSDEICFTPRRRQKREARP